MWSLILFAFVNAMIVMEVTAKKSVTGVVRKTIDVDDTYEDKTTNPSTESENNESTGWQFSWMVALYMNDTFVCSGSIISNRMILTAAHCIIRNGIKQKPENIFGQVNRRSRSSPDLKIEFDSIHTYPDLQYTDGTVTNNDVAVLISKKKIPADGKTARCICLPRESKEYPVNYGEVMAMKWVAENAGSQKQVGSLELTNLKLTKNSLPVIGKALSKSTICTEGINTGFRDENSGGPLIAFSAQKKPVQVGIASQISSDKKCKSRPSYARLSYYTDFISNLAERYQSNLCFLKPEHRLWKAKRDLENKDQKIADEYEKLNPRIIGGRDANEGEFPWMVALHRHGTLVCSSFLVTPNILMTAAHCVVDSEDMSEVTTHDPRHFTGYAGTIYRDGHDAGSQEIHFTEIIIPSEYDPHRTKEYDIALMRIAETVKIDNRTQTICFPAKNSIYENMTAEAMGWGIYDSEVGETSEILQTISLSVVPKDVCAAMHNNSYKYICVEGEEEKGVSLADSGGPLVDMKRMPPVALGTLSFSSNMIRKGSKIFVYMDIACHMDWITKEMGQKAQQICIQG